MATLVRETRPYLSAEGRRRALLDAAGRRFDREGYGGLTVQGLAEEAGVSRRLVYNHFEDQAALCEAFFVDRLDRYLTAIDTAVATGAGRTDRAALAFDALLAVDVADQRVVRLLLADARPDLDRLRARFRRHVEARWLPLLAGERDKRARAALWTVVSGLLGLADQVALGRVDRATARELAATLVQSMRTATATGDRPADRQG